MEIGMEKQTQMGWRTICRWGWKGDVGVEGAADTVDGGREGEALGGHGERDAVHGVGKGI